MVPVPNEKPFSIFETRISFFQSRVSRRQQECLSSNLVFRDENEKQKLCLKIERDKLKLVGCAEFWVEKYEGGKKVAINILARKMCHPSHLQKLMGASEEGNGFGSTVD